MSVVARISMNTDVSIFSLFCLNHVVLYTQRSYSMQCDTCKCDLPVDKQATVCCVHLCLDCVATDIYVNGDLSCPKCQRTHAFQSRTPMRMRNALNDLMAFMQLTPEELPLYHREPIHGSPVDSIFIRLRQMKYDKRRVVVLGARIQQLTSTIKQLELEIAQLKGATLCDAATDVPEISPVPEEDEYQMWPDGKLRRVGDLSFFKRG